MINPLGDAMLWKSQPRNFSGKGKDVDKTLEEWIEKMDDYFDLAQSLLNPLVRLKLWWRAYKTDGDVVVYPSSSG